MMAARLPRTHHHMLRYTFVTTMLDAGVDVDLHDAQIAVRHADPRTTMRSATPTPAQPCGTTGHA